MKMHNTGQQLSIYKPLSWFLFVFKTVKELQYGPILPFLGDDLSTRMMHKSGIKKPRFIEAKN